MRLPANIVRLVDEYAAHRDSEDDLRERGYPPDSTRLDACRRRLADAMVAHLVEERKEEGCDEACLEHMRETGEHGPTCPRARVDKR